MSAVITVIEEQDNNTDEVDEESDMESDDDSTIYDDGDVSSFNSKSLASAIEKVRKVVVNIVVSKQKIVSKHSPKNDRLQKYIRKKHGKELT